MLAPGPAEAGALLPGAPSCPLAAGAGSEAPDGSQAGGRCGMATRARDPALTSRDSNQGSSRPPGRHRTPPCARNAAPVPGRPDLCAGDGPAAPLPNALPVPLGWPCASRVLRVLSRSHPQAARGLGRNSTSPFGAETEMQCDQPTHSHLVAASGHETQGAVPAPGSYLAAGLPAGASAGGIVGTRNEGLREPAPRRTFPMLTSAGAL